MRNLLISILFVITFVVAEKSDQNDSFVATKDWQEIKQGQGIPAGLHVRINLQTGKKEAKLLDESEDENQSEGSIALAAADNASEPPTDGDGSQHNLKLSKTLTEALKNYPQTGLELEYSTERIEEIKKKYKSMLELKESYKDMKKSFKTDGEIISQLLQDYNSKDIDGHTVTKIQMKQSILEKLSYLVHQIENALWFIDEGGLDNVLLPLLNETQLPLRVQACRVLGALTQNNPKAKVKVFEAGFGRHLSQILITSSNTEELSTALYAFGSLLRKFPYAQQSILSTYGMQALTSVLSKETELKVKAKAAALISDMIVEKRVDSSKDNADYSKLDYEKWLNSYDYCGTLDALVSNSLYKLIEQPNEMEYFLEALQNTNDICTGLWSQSPQLRHALLTLQNRFKVSEDEYRVEVAQQIAKVIKLLHLGKTSHDEF